MNEEFSPAYWQALEESKRFHRDAPHGFPGTLVFAHADAIRDLIKDSRSRTVLDYGCGKGFQYKQFVPGTKKTLYAHWKVKRIDKYDPAFRRYARAPTTEHDIVIVTNTIGSVPIPDARQVVTNIYELASRAVYFGETLMNELKKKVFSDESVHPIGWTQSQWLEVFRPTPPDLIVRAGFLDSNGENLQVIDV